jgi:hypothetical protein
MDAPPTRRSCPRRIDAGASTDDAIQLGITRTAGTVTSAALIMVAVFGLFATLSTIMMQQMGFGLAVAVLIDATVIRAVLVPSTMKLLGEWNWYLPGRLAWLPSAESGELVRRVDVHEEVWVDVDDGDVEPGDRTMDREPAVLQRR